LLLLQPVAATFSERTASEATIRSSVSDLPIA
jgi:hypothetical protein